MARIVVLTLPSERNYGNRLQAYALSQALVKLDHDATMIEFYSQSTFLRSARRAIAQWYHRLFGTPWGLATEAKRLAFRRFSRQYVPTKRYLSVFTAKSWFKTVDCFIVGSDQVWNPHLTSTSSRMFLQFAPRRKRVAYAASFGVSTIPDEKRASYINWLSGIEHISVREESAAEIVESLTGRNAQVVLDPTMLLSPEEWLSLELPPDHRIPEEPFIFSYHLREANSEIRERILEYSRDTGARILDVMGDHFHSSHVALTPAEFVHAVSKADLVVTDSFHGLVFSIIMNRPVVVGPRSDGDGMNSRVITLLRAFGLEICQWGGGSSVSDIAYSINFDSVNCILNQRRADSMGWLSAVIDRAITDAESL
ncbi:MAG: polysaccharide pyruvyl transferase family protein [Propionibacteriaceae bacterium]|nr:polysaccharide pyruvyl transferase family protein [Propionibacteriaceae bacterium]